MALSPHTRPVEELIRELGSSPHGLAKNEAEARLQIHGPNELQREKAPGLFTVFFHQFLSPLIYILVAAAVVSLALGIWTDAIFIFAVLILNAVIGTIQEYGAEKSAEALRNLTAPHATVLRDGEEYVVDATALVPGDIVLLESGMKVPADLRLITAANLEIDESLLTGESLPVAKDSSRLPAESATLGDRLNMAFAGSLVTRGRAQGIATGTGMKTELGKIAGSLSTGDEARPPLLIRMDLFSRKVAWVVMIAVTLLGTILMFRGHTLYEVFSVSVALAVAVIPEGLPVALTVALAVGMSRMSKRNVIVRRLAAVEALGSCTCIASDKTGTLTMNELSVQKIALPGEEPWEITGSGRVPEGHVAFPSGPASGYGPALAERFARACALCNEGFLGLRDGEWTSRGDAVDIALLVFAHKTGIVKAELEQQWPLRESIPYESEIQFAATLNGEGDGERVFVKGALEKLLHMCSTMATAAGEVPLDAELIERQSHSLAAQGYRIIAVADGRPALPAEPAFTHDDLKHLTFLGLVGLIDPLRPEAKDAVHACQDAGVTVCMITGDHPLTAYAIASQLGFASSPSQIVTGWDLKAAEDRGEDALDAAVRDARVFARVEPRQKEQIVRSLVRAGHFVAVTGDGANDAPAMRAAHVGVAMGKRGTDVAKETSKLIITDDNFASIVAGIEEGRAAYANVRKVIFFLGSTGMGVLLMFILSVIAGHPIPFVAVQLLWLNLVTNGIQDVTLALEAREGDELDRPPRPPQEPIFNRPMIEQSVVGALVIGFCTFIAYDWMLENDWDLDRERNGVLLLSVLYQNIQVGNCRSETHSIFEVHPFRNRWLLGGTFLAQALHISAAYIPGLKDVLRVQPVTVREWLALFGVALLVAVAMEIYKYYRHGRRPKAA